MAKIALLSGSLRRESANSAVLSTVQRLVTSRTGGHEVIRLRLRTFPLFNEDLARVGGTAALRSLLARFSTADALIVSSPAYNGYPPGVLKNALDWLSVGGADSPLSGLPAAVVSASPGPAGGANVLPHLRRILANSGASVIEHTDVAIGDAVRLRTPEGLIAAPDVVDRLDRLVDTVLAAVSRANRREQAPVPALARTP
ncbi:NADPH-dependent FMN reductase [Streptomyces macrosporus]|uniref:NADPH-dependent FMN reductase-like domain-containing protein n=1 Tax=Streptomyces macrosporus TaxID=44032 RepID=A0ABN3JHZ9_9ACTN